MIADRKRDAFPTLSAGAYLLSHSLGPSPAAAADSMQRYIGAWGGHTSEDAWMSSWWELSQQVGDRFARLVGAATGSTIPTASATAAMATIASCLDYRHRPKVVTTDLDFPSMGYLWRAQERLGASVHIVPTLDSMTTPIDRVLEAIDETTAIVAVSHVSYRSSFRIDARAIAQRAHEVGALALFDVYQSAGAVEIDMADWNADVLIGGSIKWLCGGPSCGFLAVRPDLIPTLKPTITGWIAHANPFAFDAGPIQYDNTIRRFANGTPSIPSLYSVIPGLELVESVGVGAIARDSQQRTQRIVQHALEHDWPVNSPTDVHQRGATVMLGVPNPQTFTEHLRDRNVFVDWRPNAGIRLSPHFFNTDDEITQALDAIEKGMKAV